MKFLRSLHCCQIHNVQAFKDLGAVFRNCKHLKTIQFLQCGPGICELLDQIANNSTCSLKIAMPLIQYDHPYSWTSVGAEKLAGLLPRFKVTALRLALPDCCATAVNKLVCSITHKTLQELTLHDISLTPAAAAALGRSLPEMSSLRRLELTGVNGSILQVEEMEALFEGINETFLALEWLSLGNFNARGNLAPLTKRVHFFPNLRILNLRNLNMDERDLRSLLESLTSIPNLKILELHGNPLGSRDSVHSIEQQALPQVNLNYW